MNDSLLKILDAIDYADDREAFVKEFTEVVNMQAVEILISSLPQDQQDSLKTELTANEDNPEKISEILKSRFSEEQVQKSLEETTKTAVEDWMKAINPTLSDEQRQKLLDLSQELNPTPPPVSSV